MKYQFMPMFWGDFFANTLHLSAQEIGAYVLLIGHAWEHDGYIPYHGAQRIARVNNLHWPKVRAVLMPLFEWEKDTVTDTPSRGIHHRVRSELTKAAEIYNKRKGAAEQMHSKRSANANGGHHASTTTSTSERSSTSVREGEEPEPNRTTKTAEPKEAVADKKPPADFRDPGNDYRSPPKTKSDNILHPIPDRPPPNGSGFRRP